MKITVSSKEFYTFISAISNVFRGGAALKIYKNYIECIACSEDSSSIIVCSKIHILNEEDINLANGESYEINVPDLQKFTKLLSMNEEPTFTFEIKNNLLSAKTTLDVNLDNALKEVDYNRLKDQLSKTNNLPL